MHCKDIEMSLDIVDLHDYKKLKDQWTKIKRSTEQMVQKRNSHLIKLEKALVKHGTTPEIDEFIKVTIESAKNSIKTIQKDIAKLETRIAEIANLIELPAEVEPEEAFYCPITGEIMVNPVIDPDGNTADMEAYSKWLSKMGTSPFTRNKLSVEALKLNTELKERIEAWKSQKIKKRKLE
jgi:hypothetical protein